MHTGHQHLRTSIAFNLSCRSEDLQSDIPEAAWHEQYYEYNKCTSTSKSLNTGKDRFMNLKASFLASGLTTRQHGNTRHLPKHALKLDKVKNFVTFLNSYSERNAILLPGRIPGYKQDDINFYHPPLQRRYSSFYNPCPSCTKATAHSYTSAHTHTHTHTHHILRVSTTIPLC